MNLDTEQQVANTETKLALLDQWIEEARARPRTDANSASLRSLVQMANQLREEIVRYRARQSRKAS
ncbi:hypothetical protein BH09PLA1_BH09PLA1_24290 [soil metagenome]